MLNGHWDCRYESLGLTNSKPKPFALCLTAPNVPLTHVSNLLLTLKNLPIALWLLELALSQASSVSPCSWSVHGFSLRARLGPGSLPGELNRLDGGEWGSSRGCPSPSWCEDTRSWQGGQRLRKGWPEHSSGHQASLSGEGGYITVGAGTLPHTGPCPHSSGHGFTSLSLHILH